MKAALIALALAMVATPVFAQQDPGSDGNPMEEVGVLHNAYLGCLVEHDPEVRLNPIRVLIEKCGMPVEGDQDVFIQEMSRLLPPDPLASWDEKLAPYRGQFNEQQQGFLDSLKAILFRTDSTPLQVAKSLSGLGIRATEELGREPADLAVLAAISVGRHSLQFWTSEDRDPEGLRSIEARRRPWWKVIAVVGGDILGGAAGALGGYAIANLPGAFKGGVALGTSASAAVGVAIAKD